MAARLARFAAPTEPGLRPFRAGPRGFWATDSAASSSSCPSRATTSSRCPSSSSGSTTGSLPTITEREPATSSLTAFPRRTTTDAASAPVAVPLASSSSSTEASRCQRRCSPRAPPRSSLGRSELAPSWPLEGDDGLFSNFTRGGYIDTVSRAIEFIRAGDIFQVNLSQRLLHPGQDSPLGGLPAAALLEPGALCRLSRRRRRCRRQLLSRAVPLAEARRGRHPSHQGHPSPRLYSGSRRLYAGCSRREREGSRENVMIVDLLRNDISRVSAPRSVRVPRLFELEGHPSVHHLVSEVQGTLRQGLGALDLLRATFPGLHHRGAQGPCHGDHRRARAHRARAILRQSRLDRLQR